MKEDFAGWIQKGLGRAAVYLRSNDSAPHRDALLYACTHNLNYDRQCEQSRAPYLFNLIELSGDKKFYRDSILEVLSKAPDSHYDLGQLFELAALFADGGDEEMKQGMYALFERLGFARAGLTCAEEIVWLDGIAGLQFVCRTFDQATADDRPWQFATLLEALGESGKSQALPGELSHFEREWKTYDARKTVATPRLSYSDIKNRVSKYGRRAGMIGWSKKATDEEIAQLAGDLLAESDSDRLYGFLRLFHMRKFPRDPQRLLELARSEDDGLASAAMAALSHISHPEVRTLAFGAARNPQWRHLAVRMLIHNWKPGDYLFIEGLLKEQASRDQCHHLSFSVLSFIEVHRSLEAESSLLLLYETGPCTSCRHDVVKELIAIDRLPDWMREECRYDANANLCRTVDQSGSPT
jgi:hypothetical protein